jgi:hypothetical protein
MAACAVNCPQTAGPRRAIVLNKCDEGCPRKPVSKAAMGCLKGRILERPVSKATTIDALSSIALLIAITLMYPTKRLIHVFLDNARYHHAVLVQEWLAKPGCRIKVHYIPSYCSWLRLKARNRGELGRRSIRRLGEESGRTISATRPRLSTVWGWRALACPQDANSTIAEMALGAALPFGRGCLPPL